MRLRTVNLAFKPAENLALRQTPSNTGRSHAWSLTSAIHGSSQST